ncbi:PIG-L deacetylase family protein [Methanolobus mangrovi]|uniref:PIG-L deacetylase family protein n=1 Tax=Methanolobus mangrovi TaxID=3072977 RepID=A0AA51YK39_9EURY|nr:PIG-L deacetylase family protein [Methanolobus mangrovi]WMW23238.1 PIG-L deacetylase family protein [Methanolobus mangrovi]
MKKNILAIGAHPDDIELGCGGALCSHAQENDSVFCLIGSNGGKSGNEAVRQKEALESMDIIGVKDVYFLNLPDTMIKHDGITVSLLDQYVNQLNPDIIYVHSPKDYHQDHAAMSLSALSASRQMKNSVFFYESPSTTIEFRPTAYKDITGVFEQKLKCIEVFSSQKEKSYMEKLSIMGLARSRGSVIGVDYAEAFEVARLFNW